jgi:hypothetical protein
MAIDSPLTSRTKRPADSRRAARPSGGPARHASVPSRGPNRSPRRCIDLVEIPT